MVLRSVLLRLIDPDCFFYARSNVIMARYCIIARMMWYLQFARSVILLAGYCRIAISMWYWQGIADVDQDTCRCVLLAGASSSYGAFGIVLVFKVVCCINGPIIYRVGTSGFHLLVLWDFAYFIRVGASGFRVFYPCWCFGISRILSVLVLWDFGYLSCLYFGYLSYWCFRSWGMWQKVIKIDFVTFHWQSTETSIGIYFFPKSTLHPTVDDHDTLYTSSVTYIQSTCKDS
jgi:hypothetical protein